MSPQSHVLQSGVYGGRYVQVRSVRISFLLLASVPAHPLARAQARVRRDLIMGLVFGAENGKVGVLHEVRAR